MPDLGFLVDRFEDRVTSQALEYGQWTNVILQGQKNSTSGSITYPTTAAEYWIRGKPRVGRDHDYSSGTFQRGKYLGGAEAVGPPHRNRRAENTCVAPVGLVWDEVIFRHPNLMLYQPDGNQASNVGLLLTTMVFCQAITGEVVESLPDLSSFDVDSATEQIMKEVVSSLLLTLPLSAF